MNNDKYWSLKDPIYHGHIHLFNVQLRRLLCVVGWKFCTLLSKAISRWFIFSNTELFFEWAIYADSYSDSVICYAKICVFSFLLTGSWSGCFLLCYKIFFFLCKLINSSNSISWMTEILKTKRRL